MLLELYIENVCDENTFDIYPLFVVLLEYIATIFLFCK